MLASIRRFLTEIAGPRDAAPIGEEDVRLAAAALLFHVIAVDGIVTEDERAVLGEVLRQQFDLDLAKTHELMQAAEEADAEAVDLYGFTSILKRQLGEADRERIIEMMWKLVYADGTVHEFEDNVVWRVAELLGVSGQTRIRLKQSVRGNGG
jgi:uncharacterized tellurite resistance protein B-like protein